MIWPVLEPMSKLDASVPPRLYVRVVSSGSVAATGTPTLSPALALSLTLRVAVAAANTGASLTALMVMVTVPSSVPPLPSETVYTMVSVPLASALGV